MKNGGMIYLISPYTHPAGHMRAQRFKRAKQACADLMRQGEQVFSPVVYGHYMEDACDLKMSHDYWMRFCLPFLAASSRAYVLTLEGWDLSKGIKEEVLLCDRMGKPVSGYQLGDFCEDISGRDIIRLFKTGQRLELEPVPDQDPRSDPR